MRALRLYEVEIDARSHGQTYYRNILQYFARSPANAIKRLESKWGAPFDGIVISAKAVSYTR
jgi:hypothetical protein